MRIEPIATFRDNYVWALHDGTRAVLIDPGEGGPILAWLEAKRMRPLALLVTHRHADHCGGVAAVRDRYACPAYGPEEARPAVDHLVGEGDTLVFPELGLHLQVLHTPGHTLGHLAYYGSGALFCGDTLFSCGCGRVFEGTPDLLHASLVRLAALPQTTQVYPAHEYTLANLAFALSLEPEHPALRDWAVEATSRRDDGLPTLPVCLADECRRNPFLRTEEPILRARVEALVGPLPPGGPALFAAIRAWKDRYPTLSHPPGKFVLP